MHVAFNYGQATGAAQLIRFVTEHTEVRKQLLSDVQKACLTIL